MAEHYKEREHKISKFWLIVITFIIIAIVAIIFTLNHLWNYLAVYENKNPVAVVENFVNLLKSGDYEKAADLVGYEEDYFNGNDAFEKYINEKFGNDFQNVKVLNAGNEKGCKKYAIYSNEKNAYSVLLSPEKADNEFGISGWKIEEQQFEKPFSVKVSAPKEVEITLNGKPITGDFATPSKFKNENFDTFLQEDFKPDFVTYDVKNLLNEPEISVKSNQKVEYTLQKSKEDNAYVALGKPIGDEAEALKKVAETVAQKYIQFTITDCTFDEISQYLVKDTDFYKRLKIFNNEWKRQHTTTFGESQFSNLIKYDDEHFSTDIGIKIIYDYSRKTAKFDALYHMYFVKIDGEWKLATLIL
ncbi:MAG: hypothetical protein RR540_04930 [Oscillospiraceae bacterium]